MIAVGVGVGVADGTGVGGAKHPPNAVFTAATSSATVTSPSPLRSSARQSAAGRLSRAMFVPSTSSSMVTAPSPSQSPAHARPMSDTVTAPSPPTTPATCAPVGLTASARSFVSTYVPGRADAATRKVQVYMMPRGMGLAF